MRPWFFPDSYLQDVEALIVAISEIQGIKPNLTISNVLIHAQAVGLHLSGQIEKSGSKSRFLSGKRTKTARRAVGRIEQPNKNFYRALRLVEHAAAEGLLAPDMDSQRPQEVIGPANEATGKAEHVQTWNRLLDVYQEDAPPTWPQMTRRPKISKMGSRLQEAIDHAGSAADFLATASSALKKCPSFYRNDYVRKGEKLRPALDCLLCLLSSDKHHRELGVAGWRVFEWADQLDATTAKSLTINHPSEEFVAWTGTRWTYRKPLESDEVLNHHRQVLVSAGFAPDHAIGLS